MCVAAGLKPAAAAKAPPVPFSVVRSVNRSVGVVLAINFVLLWALPIAGMGQIFHLGLKRLLVPPFAMLDRSSTFRSFCEKFIYAQPKYADFGATAVRLAPAAQSERP